MQGGPRKGLAEIHKDAHHRKAAPFEQETGRARSFASHHRCARHRLARAGPRHDRRPRDRQRRRHRGRPRFVLLDSLRARCLGRARRAHRPLGGTPRRPSKPRNEPDHLGRTLRLLGDRRLLCPHPLRRLLRSRSRLDERRLLGRDRRLGPRRAPWSSPADRNRSDGRDRARPLPRRAASRVLDRLARPTPPHEDDRTPRDPGQGRRPNAGA